MPQIWLGGVWLTDVHTAAHALNAGDEPEGDGPDEDPHPDETPPEPLSDWEAARADSDTPEAGADDE